MNDAEKKFKESKRDLAFSQQLLEQRSQQDMVAQQQQMGEVPEEASQQPEIPPEQPQEAPMQEEAQEEKGVVQGVLEGVKGMLSDFMEKLTKKEEEPQSAVLKINAEVEPNKEE
jgi:hypothetical protein